MSSLAPAELFKYDTRIETFLEKYKKGDAFELKEGGSVVLRYQKTIADIIKRKDVVAARTILLMGKDGLNYRLGDLKKSAEFGGKGGGKGGAGAAVYYGRLAELKLSKYDLSDFQAISSTFASGELVKNIKEASDVIAVSDFNKALNAVLDSPDGITLNSEGFRFKNVIGCIPVTNGEPKADIVLVGIDNKNKKLFPTAYLSYKMGTRAKDFQNYSGLSEKSSPYIFNHKETKKFYQTLAQFSKSNIHPDVYQIIKDEKIIGMSVWGMDYGKTFGVNNCHYIAQGSVTISGSRLSYTHTQKNGDLNFDKEYQPVFGARFATGRNNRGPGGIEAKNYRIGIFPRAYRSAWLT